LNPGGILLLGLAATWLPEERNNKEKIKVGAAGRAGDTNYLVEEWGNRSNFMISPGTIKHRWRGFCGVSESALVMIRGGPSLPIQGKY